MSYENPASRCLRWAVQFPGLLYCLEELVHVTSNSEETYPEEKCPLWGMIPSVGTFTSGSGLCHVHQPNSGNPAGTSQVWEYLDVPRANDFSTCCFMVQSKVRPRDPIKPGCQTLESGNPDLFLLIMKKLLFNLTDLF